MIHWNEAMMSLTLVIVPMKSAKIPKTMRIKSFHKMYFPGPNLSGQRTHISINAGKAIPNADKQRAPNKDMNNPSLGIATAKATEKQ